MIKKTFLVLMVLIAALPAAAQEKKAKNPNAPDPDKIPVLQKIKEQGPDLSYDYLGRRFGTDAWLITGKGVMQIVYTTPKGVSAVVGGVLIGPDGQEVSTTMQREFTEQNPERAQALLEQARQGMESVAPAAAPESKSEAVWTNLSKLGLVTFAVKEIKAPVPIVYAVLDPDQAESREMFARLLPLAENGRLVLHVVPLLTKRADRLLDVAQVLAAENGTELWKKMIADEAIEVPETVDPKGAEGLNANVTFAKGMKLYRLPFLFYRIPSAEGWGKVRALNGVPADWEKLLKELEIQDN